MSEWILGLIFGFMYLLYYYVFSTRIYPVETSNEYRIHTFRFLFLGLWPLVVGAFSPVAVQMLNEKYGYAKDHGDIFCLCIAIAGAITIIRYFIIPIVKAKDKAS
jgi:hypothetical protein